LRAERLVVRRFDLGPERLAPDRFAVDDFFAGRRARFAIENLPAAVLQI
jgi:hypothetical protein